MTPNLGQYARLAQAPTAEVHASLASGWRRLGGYVIDGLLLSLLGAIGVGFAGGWIGDVVYFVWFLFVARRGQSPGKVFARTRVVRADGTPSGLFRTFVRRELLLAVALGAVALTLGLTGFVIFLLVYALGGLWCVFDVNNQCLWDKIAGTYVVTIEGYERMSRFDSAPPPDRTRVEPLAALRDQGLISEEEYEKRAREPGQR